MEYHITLLNVGNIFQLINSKNHTLLPVVVMSTFERQHKMYLYSH